MDVILSQLEEAVITKNKDNEISVTNLRGDKIIRMITTYELKKLYEKRKEKVFGLENNTIK